MNIKFKNRSKIPFKPLLASLLLCLGISSDLMAQGFYFLTNVVYIMEGSTATVSVVRDVATNSATVTVMTVNGTATAPADYISVSNTITFDVGVSNKTISIATIDDLTQEQMESFTVVLTNSVGSTILQNNATIYLWDNDGPIYFTSSTTTVNEGDGYAILTIMRDDTNGPAWVSYSTAVIPTNQLQWNQLAAAANQDFTPFNNVSVFLTNGQRSTNIMIPIIDDCSIESYTLVNPDNTNQTATVNREMFRVVLTNAIGAMLTAPYTNTITIVDNDSTNGVIGFNVADPEPPQTVAVQSYVEWYYSIFGSVRIPIGRFCDKQQAMSVKFRILNGRDICPGSTNAVYGGPSGSIYETLGDYTSPQVTGYLPGNIPYGTLSWGDKDNADKYINIDIIDDDRIELNEYIVIELYDPQVNGVSAPQALIGRKSKIVICILFDDQTSGAGDRTYNP
ncbi:MAG TPA: Calx-beta domain-containing protein, partial [Verrucomicrobiota bacterium]|nr:Calx-beta domain-containing protein [Verrucomicrobiota bacterium]